MPELQGKVVLVTGAARGLGRDFCTYLVQDGAHVVAADIDGDGAAATMKSLEGLGRRRTLALRADVTDLAQVRGMMEAAVDAFGRIDILINDAALWGNLRMTPLLETDPDYWDVIMRVNLKSVFLTTQSVAPIMQEQGYGRIITVSSTGAWTVNPTAYGVSKLALHQLTLSTAAVLGRFGITVNVVAPGAIPDEATLQNVPRQRLDEMRARQLIDRFGTSRDVYGAIRYLAGDDASWVTAQVISPNGGIVARL
jgi:NAD(P)-dependent dehydrogenase (short-subunit alcohol dehydrogenase family)